MRYTFREIFSCNMCGSDSRDHKVLGKRLDRSQGKRPQKKTGVSVTVCRCPDCGLVYAAPQPIPFDIQDHYGIPPESYWKAAYIASDDNYFQGELQRLRKLKEIAPGMRSLDIGAGLGKQMKALEKVGFDTYGLEPSEPFYERAVSRMGISPDRLKLTRIEDAEYPGEHFDFISFGVVLEHVYDPSAALHKAIGWLKPDGIIHIEVPSSDWLMNRLFNLYYRLTMTDHVANISPMHEPYHLYEFSPRSFTANGARNNYQIAFKEYFVCDTFLPKFLDGIMRPIMRRTGTGMQLGIWLRRT